MESTRNPKVLRLKWAELLPDEFLEKQREFPVVYLPMGLCEPHGHISAFGLDTIKAEFICERAAAKAGGIVAPTQGYHIHETGYHAPWLEEVLGEANPYMTSIPPEVLLHLFLYQLRAFSNAGFQAAVVVSGHAGGNQDDLRLVASAFMQKFSMKIEIRADPELVKGKFQGDHAGKYEISQLMYIRPDLIHMSKINRKKEDKVLGRFALGEDAAEASPQMGKEIMKTCVAETCRIANDLNKKLKSEKSPLNISFKEIEDVWRDILAQRKSWTTWNLHQGQKPVGAASKWKSHQNP